MNLKHVLIPTAVCLAIGFSVVQADDRHPPSQGRMSGQAASSPGMGMNMMDMDRMQDQMQAMQETMGRAQKTDDPEERMRLMQEHMTQMHEMMGNMRGMMGPGMMMRSSPGGKTGSGEKSGAGSMSMDERQKMMARRLDMMQQMMEQMMGQMMMQQRSEHGEMKK
ncbi:hypothetical protein Tel_11855 [Candidatus Tenderia electrophaga]|uniref:Signal recognition particle subunit FFH/SRP54 (Srp54) n=1 Tax=Candidatus Tenderia electrophaga TaxID=1748243 RepID=A0A0S2TF47_9GAMM|nr:hypothetical protein Tel_11855 [Candidatus Tenderia electrophaga]